MLRMQKTSGEIQNWWEGFDKRTFTRVHHVSACFGWVSTKLDFLVEKFVLWMSKMSVTLE